MGTTNFSKINAQHYYVVENIEDCDETISNIQAAAKNRPDGERFRIMNELEHGARYHRDEGTVILDVSCADVFLTSEYCMNLYGKIILRPGYYQDATLDWDFNIVGCGDQWHMNDYDNIDDLANDILQDWIYYADYYFMKWNGGLTKIHTPRVRRKIAEAVASLAEELESICNDLTGGNAYGRGSIMGDGTCFYHRLDTQRGRLLAAVAA